MQVNYYISALIQYGLCKKLFEPCDKADIANRLIEILQLNEFYPEETRPLPLEEILRGLLADAADRGICGDDIVSRDLLDTKLMAVLTPNPHEVRRKFEQLYAESHRAATDWFYRFSQDTNYIRRYRIQKDIRWMTMTDYGALTVAINLSEPEVVPAFPPSGDLSCPLCAEQEGDPAREIPHRIPITLSGTDWFLQYSPSAYYSEHCIVSNSRHTPTKAERSTFENLLDFVDLFPHYFAGSDADLPCSRNRIPGHKYFLGGQYCSPLKRAAIEKRLRFSGFEDVDAGIVKWPMNVIRLNSPHREHLLRLADKLLCCWRGYTDGDAPVFSKTGSNPQHSIISAARKRDGNYEIDLILRSHIAAEEHPVRVSPPYTEPHLIEEDNIGLIEAMGLAVLPASLKKELTGLEALILNGAKPTAELEKYADWVAELKAKHTFTAENISNILKIEIGKMYALALENAGVYKRSEDGRAAFQRFVTYVNQR